MLTAPGRCPNCGRILFSTREGTWPTHYNLKRPPRTRVWCVASGTDAPAVVRRAVMV